jgi:hypothetical protein
MNKKYDYIKDIKLYPNNSQEHNDNLGFFSLKYKNILKNEIY